MKKLQRILAPYAAHGVDFDSVRGDEALADSPFEPSGTTDKFHVNVKTGLWNDKKTGEGGALPQFLAEMHEHIYGPALTKKRLRKLAENRKLPLEAFTSWQDVLGYDATKGRYTLVQHDPVTGLPSTIRWWWVTTDKKSDTRLTPKPAEVGLFGASLLAKKDVPIYLCEGEWDAIAMTWLLTEVRMKGVCVAAPGAGIFKQEWAAAFADRQVRVMYHHDEPGKRGDAKVAQRLAEYASRLRFLHWPELKNGKERKTGYDLRDHITKALAIGTPSAYKRCWKQLAKEWLSEEPRIEPKRTDSNSIVMERETSEALSDLQRQWVICTEAACFVGPVDLSDEGARTGRVRLLSPRQFDFEFRHLFPWDRRRDAPSQLMLESGESRRVTSPDYLPGEPLFATRSDGCSVINIYRPSELLLLEKGSAQGDIQPYLDHVAHVIPDQQIRQLMLDWMVTIARTPMVRVNWAVALGGVTRLGKSAIFKILEWMLGGPVADGGNVTEPGVDEILRAQNDYLVGAKLLVIDTQDQEDPRKLKEVLHRLQPWITDPPKHIRINGKFKVQFDITKTVAMLLMTHKPDALPFDPGDSRFLYYWSPADVIDRVLVAGEPVTKSTPHAALQRWMNLQKTYVTGEKKTYYEVLWDWMRAHREALAHYILHEHRTSKEFNSTMPAVMTQAKADAARAGESPLLQALRSAWEEERKPLATELVVVNDIIRILKEERPGRYPDQDVMKALRKMGAVYIRQIRDGKARPRVWAMTRVKHYQRMSTEELAKEFRRQRLPGASPRAAVLTVVQGKKV